MELNLTNEEIVYIYEHFKNYKEGIENQASKEIKFMKGQMELYKNLYGETEDFDEELFSLQEKLYSEVMPESLDAKSLFLGNITKAFESAYDMISEDEGFVDDVREKYLEPSKESIELFNQITEKRGTNGKNKF